MSDKIKFMQSGLIWFSNRESTRRSNNRVFSPQIYSQIKDANTEDLQKCINLSPKSFSGNRKVTFQDNPSLRDTVFTLSKFQPNQIDNNLSPGHSRRLNQDFIRGMKTELQANYSQLESDGAVENDNDSAKLSDNSNTSKKHYYFNKRVRNKDSRRTYIGKPDIVIDIKKKMISSNFPKLDSSSPKTSFDCKPFSPKNQNFSFKKELLNKDRSRVQDKYYGGFESEVIYERPPKGRGRTKVSWLKI